MRVFVWLFQFGPALGVEIGGIACAAWACGTVQTGAAPSSVGYGPDNAGQRVPATT